MRRLGAFGAIALVALCGGTVQAQEMRALTDVFADAAEPYGPTRCGALYQAMMEWAGETRLGSETWEAVDTARQTQILSAAQIAQALSGGSLESQLENVIRDVRNIADLYIARMESNYAASGQAFADDTLIASDLIFCRVLAERLQ